MSINNQNQNHQNQRSLKSLSHTAGRLMTERVPVIEADATIGDAKKILEQTTKNLETINYIYVLNKKQRLLGVISVKEIFRLPLKTRIKSIMKTDLVSVRPSTDQERVALLALRHNLKAIPVIDKECRFLGVVPSDVILKILHTENIEDILRFSGVHVAEEDSALAIIGATARVHIKKRLPWLVLGLFGGVIAAFVVEFFEGALREQLLLAAFIPAVVYMADAAGAQSQTIFIRSLALENKLNLKFYVGREIKVSLSIALILGVLIAGIIWFGWQEALLGVILGFSIFATILIATAIAIILPWFFVRFKCDPAVASGPFATTIRDIASLIIYFSIAYLLLLIY